MEDDGQPIGYLLLPVGTPVVSRDGVDLGRVMRVMDNVREHIFDGLMVATERGEVFVDAPEVARITDRRVTLTIDAADVARLPVRSGGIGGLTSRVRRMFGRR